jgi:hypothetical protein
MSAISAIEAEHDEVIVPGGRSAAGGPAAGRAVLPRARLQLVEPADTRSAGRPRQVTSPRQGRAVRVSRVSPEPRAVGGRPAPVTPEPGLPAAGTRLAATPALTRPAQSGPAPSGPAPSGPAPSGLTPSRLAPSGSAPSRLALSRPTLSRPAQPGPALSRPAPLRLTRRGRIVFGFVGVVLATVALTVVSMSLSGAQAANHGRAGAGYQGMRQIVVQPGQTLWSIAVRAEPSADPRQVIAEIMAANSLTGSSVQTGELLWVPK